MARLGNVFNNKEDIKKEEQHPRRMIKWIHYTKLKENPGQYCPERDKEEIEALIAERTEAKKAKDFAKADAIRDELAAMGITIKDTRQGVQWFRG